MEHIFYKSKYAWHFLFMMYFSGQSNPNQKSAEEIREEEDLQLALALSRSEAENKEKEVDISFI